MTFRYQVVSSSSECARALANGELARTQKEIEREIRETFAKPEYGLNLVGVIKEGIALEDKKCVLELLTSTYRLIDLCDRATLMQSIARFISDEQTKPAQKELEKSLAKWREKSAALLQPVIAQAESEVYEAKASGEPAVAAVPQEPVPPAENTATRGRPSLKRKRPAEEQQAAQGKKPARWAVVDALEIALPSSCEKSVLERPCMAAAVGLEKSLRMVEADDALDMLRCQLITSHAVRTQVQKRDKREQEQDRRLLRSTGPIISKDNSVLDMANRYRRQYAALRALGYTDDLKYKALPPTDVKPFVAGFVDQRLGDSRETPSWIWNEMNFLNTEDVVQNFQKYAEAGMCSVIPGYQILTGDHSDQGALVPHECSQVEMGRRARGCA